MKLSYSNEINLRTKLNNHENHLWSGRVARVAATAAAALLFFFCVSVCLPPIHPLCHRTLAAAVATARRQPPQQLCSCWGFCIMIPLCHIFAEGEFFALLPGAPPTLPCQPQATSKQPNPAQIQRCSSICPCLRNYIVRQTS